MVFNFLLKMNLRQAIQYRMPARIFHFSRDPDAQNDDFQYLGTGGF
ncbi:hypothetical protein AAKU61_004646 [Undibacterium sp. GrIS 1.2]